MTMGDSRAPVPESPPRAWQDRETGLRSMPSGPILLAACWLPDLEKENGIGLTRTTQRSCQRRTLTRPPPKSHRWSHSALVPLHWRKVLVARESPFRLRRSFEIQRDPAALLAISPGSARSADLYWLAFQTNDRNPPEPPFPRHSSRRRVFAQLRAILTAMVPPPTPRLRCEHHHDRTFAAYGVD